MEPPKNCVTETSASSREGNSSQHETQQGQENTSAASATLSTESLEPKRGDHLMEPRIPEESAAVVTPHESFPSTSTEDSNTPQPYPPPKRQRTVTVREFLNQRAQQLIDEVNDKRKADTMLLTDFKKAMEMQVATSYGILEQSMYQMYERNGKIMQAKLQELFATLDRIATLEAELQKFKEALGALYTDIQYPS